MEIGTARADELRRIARMHVDATDAGRAPDGSRGRFRFYLDKVRLYHAWEPDGLLVAREGASICGFLIATASVSGFRRFALASGAAFRIALKAAAGLYGLDRPMLRKLLLLPFTIFAQKTASVPGGGTPLPDAKIWAVVTAIGHRRRGVASALLERCEERLRGAGARSVGITVAAGNGPAIAAYRKAGYGEIGRVLESTGPSIYMAKPLSTSRAASILDRSSTVLAARG